MARNTPIIILVAVSVVGLLLALLFSGLQSGYITHHIENEYTYLIYTDGVTTYAMDGNTGEISYSNLDATLVFQYALDRADYLYTKAGNYTILDTLTVYNNTLWEGAGRYTTTLSMSVNVEKNMVYSHLQDNFSIRDITFDHQRTPDHNDVMTVLLMFENCSNIELYSITAQRGQRYNLRIANCSNVHVSQSSFFDVGNDDNIAIEDYSYNVFFTGNLVSGHRGWSGTVQSGIEIDDYSHSIWIINNIVEYQRVSGIQMHMHFSDPTFSLADIYIFNNLVRNVSGRGINGVGGVATRLERVLIQGNNVVNCSGHGINLSNAPDSLIANNRVSHFGIGLVECDGIKVTGYYSYIITGNTVEHGYGTNRMLVATGCTNVTIGNNKIGYGRIGIETRMGSISPMFGVVEGNMINDVTTGIMVANPTDVVYDGNTFENIGSYCMRLETGNNLVISNNIMEDKLYIQNVQDILIEGNRLGYYTYLHHASISRITFTNNLCSEIRIDRNVDNIYFLGNKFQAGSGIYFRTSSSNGSSHIYVKNNLFYMPDNSMKGLRLDPYIHLSNVEVTGNTFRGSSGTSQVGVYVYGGDQWVIARNTFTDFDDSGDSSVSFIISPVPTNLFCRYNVGYTTENWGLEEDLANGDTFAHGLRGTPDYVLFTLANATYDGYGVVYAWDIENSDSTNISIDLYWCNGTEISDNVIWVSWEAVYEP